VTTSQELRLIAVEALTGTTLAQDRVFSPRDVVTWTGDYPMLIVTVSKARGEGLGNVGPSMFDTTATLRVVARAQHNATLDDEGSALVYEDLETLCNQVLAAVIRYPPMRTLLSEHPFFDWDLTDIGREETGVHAGSAVIDIGMRWTQGPDDFYRPAYSTINTVAIDVSGTFGTPGVEQPGIIITIPT